MTSEFTSGTVGTSLNDLNTWLPADLEVPCAGLSEFFFPDNYRPASVRMPIRICADCPIKDLCLDQALAEEAGVSQKRRAGIRGGTTPEQRVLLDSGPRCEDCGAALDSSQNKRCAPHQLDALRAQKRASARRVA